MKKQALAIAIAAALVAPSAFAAQDTSGMQFTSASEGFYASLRARLDFSGDSDATAGISESSSRIGIRGSNDLGGGLSGFYQWEGGVKIAQDSAGASTNNIRIRLGNVGLRGDFGEFVAGSIWGNDYNWVHGSTDIANQYSGYLIYNEEREGRTDPSLQYTTPDLNGFQGAVRFNVDGGETENDLDAWNISGVYAIQGFTVAGTFQSKADGQTDLGAVNVDAPARESNRLSADDEADRIADNAADDVSEDLNTWAIRLGYAQDNWYVNGWYGENNASDISQNGGENQDDVEIFSIAGGVSIDKVNLYGAYGTAENSGQYGQWEGNGNETTYGVLGVQYNLGAQSRVWIEYFSQDVDVNAEAEDIISVGLRHDF